MFTLVRRFALFSTAFASFPLRAACSVSRILGARDSHPGIVCLAPLLLFAQISHCLPQTARPIVTDRTSVPLSDTFLSHNITGMTANGDAFFNNVGTLFHWSAGSGTKTRLLQINDPMPGFPGSVIQTVGGPPQVNVSGHVAMINTWAAPGVKNPAGIFVYDGAQYRKVVLAGEAVPGVPGAVFSRFRDLRVNANDQVAFVAEFEPIGEDMLGVFLGSPTSAPVKIASAEDVDAVADYTPDNIYILGVDNAGNVALLCGDDGRWDYSLVVGSPTGVLSALQWGSDAPGTAGSFNLSSNRANYQMNASGDVAFFSNVLNAPGVTGGVWVRNLAGVVQKIACVGDATGTSLAGTYNSITLRGFNDGGQVLYFSNLNGATTTQALFRKKLSTAAEVVCYRNQAFSGTQQIDGMSNATLGPSGKAAVWTTLKNPSARGLLLWDPSTPPETVVLEGSATPIGGAYTQVAGFRMNGSDQVLFSSVISTLNANGLFLWTRGQPTQPVMNTTETILPGTNPFLLEGNIVASGDEALFCARSGEGKDTIFTKSLRPGDETIRRVIGDGDMAPGGGVIANINRPAMNDKEEVVIFSTVIGVTPYPTTALWMSRPGSELQKLATVDDPAPGAAGGAFMDFPSPARINERSEVAFYANVKNSAGNASSAGIFLVSPQGAVQKIARVGDASPAGGTFASIHSTIYLSDIGTVAFRATSQIAQNQQIDGYFVGSAAAAPVKLMAVGDAWRGDTFSPPLYDFKMNSAGQVAFYAGRLGQGDGIFIAVPGIEPAPIALENDETSTPPGGVSEVNFPNGLDINSSGQVAFWAAYADPSSTPFFGTGYFIGAADQPPRAILTTGQALPGGGTCPLFAPVTAGLALADSGELAMYVPGVSDAPDFPMHVIASSEGTLRRFVAVGETAAETDSQFGRLGSVGANSSGDFLVQAVLVGGPVKQGLFRNAIPEGVDLDRFHLSLSWETPDGHTGWGHPVKLTSQSAYFYFFDPNNLEVMVKILDGRAVNGSFWVFYGALTDLKYDLIITDTLTGASKIYSNPMGTQAGRYDLAAFPDSSASSTSSRSPTALGQSESILLRDRFQVEVDWTVPSGSTGKATGVTLTSDSGYCWFFGSDNIELVFKVLDGTGVNGHFWVFWGSLTDVQYTVKVTDTVTGALKVYRGQQGVQSSGYDLLAF